MENVYYVSIFFFFGAKKDTIKYFKNLWQVLHF